MKTQARLSTYAKGRHIGLVSLIALFLITALFSLDVDPSANSLDLNLLQSAAAMDAQLHAVSQYLPAGFSPSYK